MGISLSVVNSYSSRSMVIYALAHPAPLQDKGVVAFQVVAIESDALYTNNRLQLLFQQKTTIDAPFTM